ncbi:MAG: AMED_5909 family protein [Labedaea sp.]
MSDRSVAWREVEACQTLIQVHEAVARLRPCDSADDVRWRNCRLRSATAYERIADIDRGHHYEALYWAQRERKHANNITLQRAHTERL